MVILSCCHFVFCNKLLNSLSLSCLLENPGATLIRGLRGAADLESEKIQQIYVEKMLGKPLNAVYITCDREFDHISSSAFKQLVKVDKAQAALCCPNGIPEEL